MTKKTGWVIPLAVGLGAVLLMWVCLLLYSHHLRLLVDGNAHDTMLETIAQQSYNFNTRLQVEEDSVEALAAALAISPDVRNIQNETLLQVSNTAPFDFALVADKEGQAIDGTGQKISLADREYFHRALAGDTVLSEPLTSKVNAEEVVMIAAPIWYQNQIIGVLAASYMSRDLDEFLLPSFDGAAYAYVVTDEGEIVARSTSAYAITHMENLFDSYETAEFYALDDFATIKKNVAADEGGHSKYELDGQKRVLHYDVLGTNGWNVFVIVPEEVVFGTANAITFSTTLLSLVLAGVFMALLAFILIVQKRNIKKLEKIVFVDELTGAPTLVKFKLDAQALLDENPEAKYVLLKIDIDGFKLINQTLGFEVGDKALISVAKAAAACSSSKREIYGRANIDEFVLLHEYETREQLVGAVAQFKKVFAQEMGEDFTYDIRFVGGCYYMQFENCRDIAAAFEKVNIAHRTAKNLGIESCVYDETFIKEALRKKDIENRMELALQNREFKLYLQPKYRLENESISGAEALVRWQEGAETLAYPGDFIPIFEANGFVLKLDMYMFEETCRALRGWIEEGLELVPVSVNFSRLHLATPNFVKTLCVCTERYNVPRKYLEIELTETVIYDNEEILVEIIDQLHEAGFTLSMDDFGTGYSSLGLLKNIPVDSIKIDRSFFTTAKSTSRAYTVISNVLRMASELSIHTVAEGVETKEHIDLLRELNCDMVQGFYYARPMPKEEFEALMRQ